MFEHRFKYQDPLLMWMLYCTNRQNHITGQGLPWERTMIGQLSNDLFKKKLLFHTIFLFSSRLYTIQWFSIWCYFIWVCTHFLRCEHSLFLLPKPHPDQTASVTHRFHVSSMSLTTLLFSFRISWKLKRAGVLLERWWEDTDEVCPNQGNVVLVL